MSDQIFFLNATPTEEFLMRLHTRAYWLARVAAACVLLAAFVASWPALENVHAFLSRIGLLRFGLASSVPAADADSLAAYTMSVLGCGALAAVAWGLWMFRAWAWWLVMGASLLLILCVLFLMPQWLAIVLLPCLLYALLLPSYAIFAEPSVARMSRGASSTCSS